jgi:hypothetical protein
MWNVDYIFINFQGKEQSSEKEKKQRRKKKEIEWDGNMSIIQRGTKSFIY